MAADRSPTEFITFLAKELVDHPTEVEVREVDEGEEIVVELIVAESDLGVIIGRQGKTARALRPLLSAATAKSGRRYSLEILE